MNYMNLLLLFIEGLLAFISPCFLPMLPIYLSYLAGINDDDKKALIKNTLGFIIGFTIVFTLLGMTATSLGKLLVNSRKTIEFICGVFIIILGLNMIGIIKIGILNRDFRLKYNSKGLKFFTSILFGFVIAFGWSPCIGSFLSVALIKASNQSSLVDGAIMLFIFSLGLSLPILVTALLFNKLTNLFNFIKKHYKLITTISGIFLIIMGLLMIFNKFTQYIRHFN